MSQLQYNKSLHRDQLQRRRSCLTLALPLAGELGVQPQISVSGGAQKNK
jgi:hypothetical protein